MRQQRTKFTTYLLLSAAWFSALGFSNANLRATEPSARWWRGNLHTHSLWSDGDDFPEMIADWYKSHGYHFLALSDHNILSEGTKFMSVATVESRGGGQVLRQYVERFGTSWVETRGEPNSENYAVRLKPLDEFRCLLEERERFIMIQGEEISDQAEGGPVHMNATNLTNLIEPSGGATVRDAMRANLRMAEEQAKQLGREILVHLNHPNFGYAVTAEDIAAVIQERYFEVFNGHPAVGQLGDEYHPSIERMWDIANTIRIAELHAAPIMGVATDDSHNYHGKPNGARSGRGWVMVRSKYLTPEYLIRAMNAGDFYASSGVTLEDIDFHSATNQLTVRVAKIPGETYTIQFIGTRKQYDATSEPRPAPHAQDDEGSRSQSSPLPRLTRKYSSDVGATLAAVSGSRATYQMQGDELYVRAVVTSSADHPDASFPNQKQQAWTQPIVPSVD